MTTNSFDVVIIGAGPAGTAAAIALQGSSLSVALIDKSTFPRDKTCGDALSVDVVNQLGKLSPDLVEAFLAMATKTPCGGVRIVAPSNDAVDIPFHSNQGHHHGYVCKRLDFDMLMFSQARKGRNITIMEQCEVKDVRPLADRVHVNTTQGQVTGKVIIAADGAHSVVKRKLTSSKIDPKFHSAGLRMYHAAINGFNTGSFIELYFIKEILPGYLWIFQLPGGNANVGIGMLSSAVAARRVNLTKTLYRLLATHPLLAARFRNAVPLESPRGHGLPLGGSNRCLSGDRFLLTGDAASLIDPFSGEGIGNAIRSGRFAAAQVLQSFATGNFTGKALSQYDQTISKMLSNEFRVSRAMLRLCQYPWLFNKIVAKANRNAQLHRTLVDALAFPEKKQWLVDPAFYFNLLFR